jgi:hypothetical protein
MILELFPVSGGAALLLQATALLSFAWLLLSRVADRRHNRLIPGVYVAGLKGGKVSLSQARQDFIHGCIDLMLEGYQKVWMSRTVFTGKDPFPDALADVVLDRRRIILCSFACWGALDDSHQIFG